ncbi:MAG: hypothetical protein KME22_03905 [Hassallia sp. WJT32-NPBG1]|nr:hypothetical protein [Spirirestis rafaelensis WJT71-NPBG6]MBW4606376.1 hypothetical protein [Hassallia sp. WJT32-NPBG1]
MKILSALLISAIALRVACGIALTSPVLVDNYQPANNGHIKSTRVFDCGYRGSDRREGCS